MGIQLTKEILGQMLKKELNYGYDPLWIADWAYNLFCSSDYTDNDLTNILSSLAVMVMGDEFIYSKQQLEVLAEALLQGDSEPFKRFESISVE